MKRFIIASFLTICFIPCFSNNTDSLILELQNHKDDTNKVNLLFEIAQNHLNNYDSALYYSHLALDISNKIQFDKGRSNIYNLLGIAHYKNQQFDSAIVNYQKSLEYSKIINNQLYVSNCYNNIGLVYLMKGEFRKSIESFQASYNIRIETNNTKGAMETKCNIGTAYYYVGDYNKSILSFIESATTAEKIKDSVALSSNYNNIGSIYLELNDLKKAKDYFTKSIEIDKKLNDYAALSYCYGNLGKINYQLGQYQEAIQNFDQVLKIEETVKNTINITEVYKCYADVLIAQGNYKKAESYFINALDLSTKNQIKNIETSSLLGLAELYNIWPSGNKTKAINYAKTAMKLAHETGSLAMQSSANLELYKANKFLGNHKIALEYLEKHKSLNDSLLNAEKHKQVTELETKYQTSQKEKEIESLHKDNEIKNLQIEEDKQRSKAQRRLLAALIFSFFSIAILIWFLFKNYKKQQIIKQQKLEYQKILTEQKMLRSQMNPHFIYNSLNSIQSFISSEQSYEAEKYLAKFAKLIRGILENSRVDFISLDKEIEVLELYLSLEQLRFENRFTYIIYVEDTIEEEFISIPPMLVQPFVENAILHGFQNRTNGKININFMEKEDYIICEIDDNGIGRIDSEEKQTKKKHQSLATTITQERLDALSHELKKEAWFTIEDKIDPETQKPLGTKVIMQIPFIEN